MTHPVSPAFNDSAPGSFAALITHMLNVRNMTQTDLALRIGVSSARITQILLSNGNPTLKTMARIADALNCRLIVNFEVQEE